MHALENFPGLKIRGRGLVSWSSITRTFLEDNNTVSRDLAIVPGTLRCATYDAMVFMFTDAGAHFMQYTQLVIALLEYRLYKRTHFSDY